MNKSVASVAVLSLALPVLAQNVTATICERMTGFLRAEHIGVAAPIQITLPQGHCFTGPLPLSAQSGVANGALSVVPVAQGRVHGVDAAAGGSADTNHSPAGASVSTRADFVVQLTAAQPVRGVLAIRIESRPSGGAYGFGNFQVDLDDDGTVELTGRLLGPPWVDYLEIPRSFGPGTLPVHVTHAGQVSVPAWFIGEYSCNLSLRWIPDTGAVAPFGPSCGLMLREERQGNGDFGFILGFGGTPAPNTWLLFGLTQRSVVLPLAPGCVRLTDMDVVLPWLGQALVVSNVPLPPGLVLHAQAVQFAALQSTLTSNGLRLVVSP